PEVMAEDHDSLASCPVFLSSEGPAKYRRYTERLEEAFGHAPGGERDRVGAVGQVQAVRLRRRQLDQPAALAPVKKIRRRRRLLDPLDLTPLRERHHLVGVSGREWAQQHAVDDAEDGRGRADAKRQREHNDEREAWLLAKGPRGNAHVGPERQSVAECGRPATVSGTDPGTDPGTDRGSVAGTDPGPMAGTIRDIGSEARRRSRGKKIHDGGKTELQKRPSNLVP